PGVRHTGLDSSTWADHTDVRPTILSLVGLSDDYAHDGRVLWDDLYGWAVPTSLQVHRATLTQLAQVYKQLDASVGQFALDTLKVSTAALESNAASDATYTNLESQLTSLGSQRDSLAAQMSSMLEGAAFGGMLIDEQQ